MNSTIESVITHADGTPKGGNPYQNNARWLEEKTGCLSASRIGTALKLKKDGTPTKEADDLVKEILAERMTGVVMRKYVTPEMQRGIDLQPEAEEAYEVHTGNFVRHVGFIPHPTIDMCGASPDGLVDDDPEDGDGLAEFKCPNTTTHLGYMAAKIVPMDYRPQMLLQMACTRRSWCDFVSFDPRVKEKRLRLFVVRYRPEPEEIATIETAAREILRVIDNLWEQINGGSNGVGQ